jgi:hypothetical protein
MDQIEVGEDILDNTEGSIREVGRPRLRWLKMKRIIYKSEKRADGGRKQITYRNSRKAGEGS